jgi:hypothetical protein
MKKAKYLLKWHYTGQDHFKRAYQIMKKKFRKEERKARELRDLIAAEKLGEIHANDKIKFWQKCKIKTKNPDTLHVPVQEAATYFKNFFSKTKDDEIDRKEEEILLYLEKINTQFSIEVMRPRLERIIKELPNNKSIGYQKISNEMIKYSDNVELLALLLEKMVNEGKTPHLLNIGLITPILKDKNECHFDIRNSRPITISDCIPNIFEKYVMDEITSKLSDTPCQFGFKSYSSCMHANYMLKEIIMYYKLQQKPVYACAIDLKKAFDKMSRTLLFAQMKEEINSAWWKYLYNYYKSSYGIVSLNNQRSNVFKIEDGVKQGGPLSPRLFSRYIQPLAARILGKGLICQKEESEVGLIFYADDIIIMCESLSKLELALMIVEDFCKEQKITINGSKSQLIKFNGNKEPAYITINETRILNVPQIKYLGVIIDEKVKVNAHLEDRKAKATNAMYIISQWGAYKDTQNVKMRMQLYKTYVRPVLLYGLELFNMETQLDKITRFEALLIKRLLGINKYTHTKQLLSALPMETMEITIWKRKWVHLIT